MFNKQLTAAEVPWNGSQRSRKCRLSEFCCFSGPLQSIMYDDARQRGCSAGTKYLKVLLQFWVFEQAAVYSWNLSNWAKLESSSSQNNTVIIHVKCDPNRLRVYGGRYAGRKWPFPITLASGLYNSLYYRTSRDESWQNDYCSFRAMNVALTLSFKLISFWHLLRYNRGEMLLIFYNDY